MQSITLRSRVSADGILRLEIPVELANQELDLILVYQTVREEGEEAKEIPRSVLIENPEPPLNFASKIRQRFTSFGDLELPEITRDALREPPTFEDSL